MSGMVFCPPVGAQRSVRPCLLVGGQSLFCSLHPLRTPEVLSTVTSTRAGATSDIAESSNEASRRGQAGVSSAVADAPVYGSSTSLQEMVQALAAQVAEVKSEVREKQEPFVKRLASQVATSFLFAVAAWGLTVIVCSTAVPVSCCMPCGKELPL